MPYLRPQRRSQPAIVVVALALAAGLVCGMGAGPVPPVIHVSARGDDDAPGSARRPLRSLAAAFRAPLVPGTVIRLDPASGPLLGDTVVDSVRGTPDRPIVISGAVGGRRALLRGRLRLTKARHVTLEGIAFEPEAGAGQNDGPALDVEGDDVTVRDCAVTGVPGDGVRLCGRRVLITRTDIAAGEGVGLRLAGETRAEACRVTACRVAGIAVEGAALIANSFLLHNRGPALAATGSADLGFCHNLLYDNGGGVLLEPRTAARIINNIFVNNYAGDLLGPTDVEIRAATSGRVAIDYNIYFRHPGKDKLLRGLPYGQGVDLAPLAPDNPFGLRFELDGRIVLGLSHPDWRARFDRHSQSLDILQRFTSSNSYTRSYEDLFADFQQEDFRPRFTSPAVGRGLDLTAQVPHDAAGRRRSAAHPDIGPYAAPPEWWADIDSGRATLVDGTVPLDEQGRDTGLGTAERPFSTLAKAAAFARWGSRVYIRDAIYRHSALQTTFSLGPEGLISAYPGHRPAFSPSEHIATERWEKLTEAGLHRIRDWHTFLGYNHRMSSWIQDYHGNSRLGGPQAGLTALARNTASVAEPFRPVRFFNLDRDTPQVLADGIALQPAGGVLGLEEFGIGTCSVWGRDPVHLRPGSFMVGRRDFLVSHTVGRGRLADGQYFLEGPNPRPEQNCRIAGKEAGYVSMFVARPPQLWHQVHAYPQGDRLWQLDPAAVAPMGQTETRTLNSGWVRVQADTGTAGWVRQFALPVIAVQHADSGASLTRCPATAGRAAVVTNGWRQRQFETGDPALAAVLDNPCQDYLEVRLPLNVDPNAAGLRVTYFSGRIEAVWRRAATPQFNPGMYAPGFAMFSRYRTMEAGADLAATAGTAREAWSFGFLVLPGAASPVLLMRMPPEVDPNAEDPWKFTVVDDCLYVWLPGGADPARHSIEAACAPVNYVPQPGGNCSFSDWEPAGLLNSNVPAARIYRTALDFGANPWQPLWPEGRPVIWAPGFTLDPRDRSGRTLRLLDEVRLDEAGTPPAPVSEKFLVFTYLEGDPDRPARREYRLPVCQVGPDRRVTLPSRPVGFPPRYALLIETTNTPIQRAEQRCAVPLRLAGSRAELEPGAAWYDATAHEFLVCPPDGNMPEVLAWSGARAEPLPLLRGIYTVGGNAYGHQKQYGWGTGMGIYASVIEDCMAGFNTGRPLALAPGGVLRDCLYRWCQSEIGMGGEVSGDERHTANRVKRPELHVDHCIFDLGNAFLFDGNDNPTKNIPFANHHIWERSVFLPAMGGMMGPWWDQYCFNNVVQNCIFAGRGGVDVEVSENFIVRNNIFMTDKGMSVTFRGSDRGYVFNNAALRGGGIWFHSEPQRLNIPGEQGRPTYGPSFPVEARGPVPWLEIEAATGTLGVQWQPCPDHPEVYYCENWDFPTPLLIDAQGFAAFRPAASLAGMPRGTYYHDAAARRLYIRRPDGSAPEGQALTEAHIVQTEAVRRDMVYTLTTVRGGRLSFPHRFISQTEWELTETVRPGDRVTVRYHGTDGAPREERFTVTAQALSLGRPRFTLREPATNRLAFVAINGARPPRVRVTASHGDIQPYEAELVPGASLPISKLLRLSLRVRGGHFPVLRKGDQFETVLHSRSVYHLASLNNLFLDGRSSVAPDRSRDMHHGQNYLLWSEHTDASHSVIDHNCYWKDLQAVPGPLSAYIHWGRELIWNTAADQSGITLAEFHARTGYEAHGLTPASYFALVANPLRYDFRPLPDAPLLGAGQATKLQVGDFLFDPDAGNGYQRFTFKGNAVDITGAPRGTPPSIGPCERPLPGARAYYVSPAGRDGAGRGTRSAPWASVAFALARMRPGDLLVMLPGTYRERLVIRRSGTPRDFLHIVAENPPYETPTNFPHTGQTVLAPDDGSQPAVLLDGCAHVRLAGLRVRPPGPAPAVELRHTRDCVLEYVYVDAAPQGSGIRVTGRGNTLYECRVTGGMAGYELAGSLHDLRWCVAASNSVGWRAVGPLAGLLARQNRGHEIMHTGFDLNTPASDLTLDGNWVDSATGAAFQVAGDRLLLVNNQADHPGSGIVILRSAGAQVFNNTVVSAARDGLVLESDVQAALVLNNILQAEHHNLALRSTSPAGLMWSDYNLYTRSSLPFGLTAQRGAQTYAGLDSWRSATGFDRNSLVAPLIYEKYREPNGRWRIRERAIRVDNFTPHFNCGPLGANAYPYTGGGTYILDIPGNWQPWGTAERRVFRFGVEPHSGALAARMYWHMARLNYRRQDGTRAQIDLYRVDLPPERMPPGSFFQPADGIGVFVRLPMDAEDPNPIGTPRVMPVEQAVGWFVAREARGHGVEALRGKLLEAATVRALAVQGVQEVMVVANQISCLGGSATLEKGCPILGLYSDADSMCRPAVPGSLPPFGGHGGPGRFDIGACEHGYFVP